MDGEMVDGCMDGWMGGWVGGWMDGGMDGWVDGWVNGWIRSLQQFVLRLRKSGNPAFLSILEVSNFQNDIKMN
jgi:hypothetical protein